MPKSKLQHSEIPLRKGLITVEPGGEPRRSEIQLQFNVGGLKLYKLSPEEAYTLGSSLVDHAEECGYDPDTGETSEVV